MEANADQARDLAALRQGLARVGLERITDELARLAAPALRVVKLGAWATEPRAPWLGILPRRPRRRFVPAPCQPGGSRIGGLPDLPPDMAWPVRSETIAQFLMQVRCADLAAHASWSMLPTEGMLWFFLLRKGIHFEPVVVHRKDVAAVQPVRPPVTGRAMRRLVLPPRPVTFAVGLTLPGLWGEERDRTLGIRGPDPTDPVDSESETLDRFLDHWCGLDDGLPKHQMLGHPQGLQHDVLRALAMAAAGQASSPDAAAWQRAEGAAAGWRLLLQFDSDRDLRLMWGDAGMVYFGIRDDDLRSASFERTVVTWQCN